MYKPWVTSSTVRVRCGKPKPLNPGSASVSICRGRQYVVVGYDKTVELRLVMWKPGGDK